MWRAVRGPVVRMWRERGCAVVGGLGERGGLPARAGRSSPHPPSVYSVCVCVKHTQTHRDLPLGISDFSPATFLHI